jgi:hypothetical protein
MARTANQCATPIRLDRCVLAGYPPKSRITLRFLRWAVDEDGKTVWWPERTRYGAPSRIDLSRDGAMSACTAGVGSRRLSSVECSTVRLNGVAFLPSASGQFDYRRHHDIAHCWHVFLYSQGDLGSARIPRSHLARLADCLGVSMTNMLRALMWALGFNGWIRRLRRTSTESNRSARYAVVFGY